MKQVKVISILTTVYNIILVILLVIGAVTSFIMSDLVADLTNGAADSITNVDPSSIVAGYQVVIGAFGFLGGVVGTIILYVMAFFLLFLAGYFLVPSIEGIIVGVKAPKVLAENPGAYLRSFKVDGIMKTIFNGIPTVLVLLGITGDMENIAIYIIPFLLFAGATGGSIFQVVQCSNLIKEVVHE